ncbi:MAG: methyltransferase domain-containing protein [Luteitalea sp.]|nr:methyltransferase domain-containing protein [Luteitalea sp.]
MWRHPRAPPLTARANLRWAVVSPILRGLRPGNVLELGCGQGAAGARIAAVARYTAVEPDETSWRVAEARIAPLGGSVLHGDHHTLPDGAAFDLVCAFEVLEHIADDHAALAEWVQLVRRGGHVLLSVPADPERFGPSDELVGHHRRYTPEALRKLLTEVGCVEVVLRRYGWPLDNLLERMRNRIAERRVASAARTAEERSAGSGRFLQPDGVAAGPLVWVCAAPFTWLQRLAPNRGPGLVALARRPDEG